jgi:hypothetical protein
MMMDAYAPEGKTTLAKDSIFMMPQLGILSTLLPEAATQVFERDCLIRLGDCLAPVGVGKDGDDCVTLVVNGGETVTVPFGQIKAPAARPRRKRIGRSGSAPRQKLRYGRGQRQTRQPHRQRRRSRPDHRHSGASARIPEDDHQRAVKSREWLEALGLKSE